MPRKFEKPRDYWLPYWRAFLALDTVNRQILSKELEGIAAHIRRRGNVFKYGEFIDLEVNFETGNWSLKYQELPDVQQSIWEWSLLDDEKNDDLTFAITDDETKQYMRDWKAGAKERGQEFLRKAISWGHNVYAHVSSPLSPAFKEVPPEILLSFEVENIHAGTLVCRETNERLYAVHIDPNSRRFTSPESGEQRRSGGRPPWARENAMWALRQLSYG